MCMRVRVRPTGHETVGIPGSKDSMQLQAEGYLARSAFKLLELQSRHKVIPKGDQAGLVVRIGLAVNALGSKIYHVFVSSVVSHC